MSLQLKVQNYRGLRQIHWDLPTGLVGLVGANGAGKSTLLDVPFMLGDILRFGALAAIDLHGGRWGVKNLLAKPSEGVALSVRQSSVEWLVALAQMGTPYQASIRESISVDEVGEKANLQLVIDRSELAHVEEASALRETVISYATFDRYDMDKIRTTGSLVSSDRALKRDGENVFSVLRNWRDRREDARRIDFVLSSLADAFPSVFGGLDFESSAQRVAGRIVLPGVRETIPTFFASHGLLVAMLHLTAVASPRPFLAIDEFENGLHPFAIKRLLESIRAYAEETKKTVIVATHSPVVIDQFKDQPSHLFVLESGEDALQRVQPVSVDKLRDPDWLSRFSLGDLFTHEEFGAPARSVGT